MGLLPATLLSKGRFSDRYKLGSKIGQGHFGVVREVTEKATSTTFACKIILKPSPHSAASPAEAATTNLRLRREAELGLELSQGGSSRFAKTLEVFEDEHRVYMVMELCKGGSLAEYVDRRRDAWANQMGLAREASLSLSEMEAMRKERRERLEMDAAWVLAEVAASLAHCHAQGILHRDVKPENVLLTEPLEAWEWVSGLPPRPPTAVGENVRVAHRQRFAKIPRVPSFTLLSRERETSQEAPQPKHRFLRRVFSVGRGPRLQGSQSMPSLCSAGVCLPTGVRLADFGLAERILEGGAAEQGMVGSPAYAAPEVVQGKAVGFASDVWGLGMILYFMLSDGRLPFSGRNKAMLLRSISRAQVDASSPALVGASAGAKALLQVLLAADPDLRPTPAQVLELPWIEEQLKKRSAALAFMDRQFDSPGLRL